MEGHVINYRQGVRTITQNQLIIIVSGIDTDEKAKTLIGKTVVYTCEGKAAKKISGKISAVHGKKGAVRAIFETGLPGQAVGGTVLIN